MRESSFDEDFVRGQGREQAAEIALDVFVVLRPEGPPDRPAEVVLVCRDDALADAWSMERCHEVPMAGVFRT